MGKRKIFISYSHQDKTWKVQLVKQLEVLQIHGNLEIWVDTQINAGAGWYNEIKKAIDDSDAAVLLISADFLTSDFILKDEVPELLQRKTEEGMKIFPLIVKHCPWAEVQWLSTMQVRPEEGKPLSEFRKPKREKVLSEFAVEIKNLLNKKGKAKAVEARKLGRQKPDKISLSKLPTTGEKFFGRKEEIKALDAAWEDEHTHIVTLIAWGGVGKSALVNHWLNLVERKNYCGAQKVYGWSFYSQGAEEGKQASADEFMQETLAWFGDPKPEDGSAVEKGRRLARLVREQRTLLILDGLEPLQYPPGEVQGFDGKLKDQGLKTLLKELSGGHPGLCVITSREPITDLAHKKKFAVKEMELEHLSSDAGMQLLKGLEVKGSDKEMAKAVEEYKGHALALTLLGRYIKKVYDGDIRKRDKIPSLTGRNAHAQRVMEAYEIWLKESPELNVLHIMGLFDRPVEKGAVDALREDPAIPGMTDKLQKLSEEDWQLSLYNLRTVNLLAGKDPLRPDMLDCHPLIREHFGEKLHKKNPEGWEAAHKRLYHYYKNLPEKELPDTLQEMEPLFAAVAHGCSAGMHQKALDEVYWKRISRKDNFFSVRKLGAFGADLVAMSYFFEESWTQPAAGLTDADKALVLSWTAFRLRAVGRLQEAIQPFEVGMEMSIRSEDWEGAALDASNLSQLVLTLGEAEKAVSYARQSVTHADLSGDSFEKEVDRTTLADALHQNGQLEEAEQWFREAEKIQKERQPEYQYLYSLQGYFFCDLLLSQGKYTEVMERAENTLEWSEKYLGLFDRALDNLSLGRAWMMKLEEDSSSDFTHALEYLNQAVTGLRESGYQHHLPCGLLARAECYRLMKQFSRAWDDLKEAEEIAELGSMKLHLCDYHLEAGRLSEAEGKEVEADHHFSIAKEMIEETGYFRRKKRVVRK